MAKATEGAVYQAKFGLDRHTKKMLLYSLGFVVAGVFISLPVAIATWVFFGGGGLLLLYRALQGNLALRVDEQGVTLGATAHQGRDSIPWSEIEALASWVQPLPMTSMPWVGVVREPRVDFLGEFSIPGMYELAPHVPNDVVDSSRPVSGWGLERERMIAVARGYVPDLPVKDFG